MVIAGSSPIRRFGGHCVCHPYRDVDACMECLHVGSLPTSTLVGGEKCAIASQVCETT